MLDQLVPHYARQASQHFNPMANVGGNLTDMASHFGTLIDPLLSKLGVNPQSMTPAQKAMLLGGTGVAGAGAATGHPLMATAGGASALLGMLPLLQQYAQQHGMNPLANSARPNEWEIQQQINQR